MIRTRLGIALLALLGLTACLDDFEVEKMTFPCRSEGDCVDGYECDESRWVCVPVGATDSGVIDAGTVTSTIPDAGI